MDIEVKQVRVGERESIDIEESYSKKEKQTLSNDKKVDRTLEHVFSYPRQETLIESRNRLLSNHTVEESSKPREPNFIASAD